MTSSIYNTLRDFQRLCGCCCWTNQLLRILTKLRSCYRISARSLLNTTVLYNSYKEVFIRCNCFESSFVQVNDTALQMFISFFTLQIVCGTLVPFGPIPHFLSKTRTGGFSICSMDPDIHKSRFCYITELCLSVLNLFKYCTICRL